MFKLASCLSALALAALLAAPAHAQAIWPNPTTFTTLGGMTISPIGRTCEIVMQFSVPTGGTSATVTNAYILGSGGCSDVTFNDLPWNVRVGVKTLYIDGVKIVVGSAASCGPGTLEVAWTNGGGGNGTGSFLSPLGACSIFGIMSVATATPIHIY
jgi:hypothetical protein